MTDYRVIFYCLILRIGEKHKTHAILIFLAFFFAVSKLICNFAGKYKMDKKTMNTPPTHTRRTRDEIIAWWQQARARKEAFQKETNEWWQARQRGLKEAEESGYYNIETA